MKTIYETVDLIVCVNVLDFEQNLILLFERKVDIW